MDHVNKQVSNHINNHQNVPERHINTKIYDSNYIPPMNDKNSGLPYLNHFPNLHGYYFPNNTEYGNSFPYDVLLVVLGCHHNQYKRGKFTIQKSKYPTVLLLCNLTTNWKDLRDGGMMIRFIVDVYDNPLAKKYIFIQEHDKSWHYRVDVWDRLDYITTTNYFKSRDFGGIFCEYWTMDHTTDKINNLYNSLSINKFMKELNIFPIMNSRDLIKRDDTFPCCMTLFISSSLFNKYPKENYENFYNSVRKYIEDISETVGGPKSDKLWGIHWHASVLFETIWHNIYDYKQIPYPPNCEIKIQKRLKHLETIE